MEPSGNWRDYVEPPPTPLVDLVTDQGEIRPWDQQPRETPSAYRAFRTYLEYGPGRTIVAAFRLQKRKPNAAAADGTWTKWSVLHRWVERVKLYEARVQRISEQMTDREVEIDAANRLKAKQTYRDRMFKMADQLVEKAEAMLKFPLEEVTRSETADGKTTIVTIAPVRWRMGDVGQIIKAAYQINELVAQMDRASQTLNLNDFLEQLAQSEGLDDEEKQQAMRNLQSLRLLSSAPPKSA